MTFPTHTLIKAGNIAHLTDARYFAAKSVDYLGFNLEEGTRGYLDPMYMKAIREWVEGPRITGEFSTAPIAHIQEAAAFYGLDAVQVSALQHGAGLSALQGLDIILHIPIGTEGLPLGVPELTAMAQHCHLLLFDISHTNLSVEAFYREMDFWKALFALRPSLLQAGFPAADWPAIVADFGLAGIALEGGEEEAVGIKSYEEIDLIFESFAN